MQANALGHDAETQSKKPNSLGSLAAHVIFWQHPLQNDAALLPIELL
jgi:hypothetical protein